MNKIEKQVLAVYSRVNPSLISVKNDPNLKLFFKKRQNLFNLLHVSSEIFENRNLLDIGGGTGEKSLFYATLGSNITLLDANSKSIYHAKKLFKKHHYPINTINQSLSQFNFKIIEDYDIVICDGILHHTENPIKNLKKILKHLKKNSIFILGISESNAYFKRTLLRDFIRKYSDFDEKKIIFNSKKFFYNHIDKAVKFGGRNEKAVIFDSFINPQIVPISLHGICESFYKNKVKYVSSFPTLTPFFDVTSFNKKRPDYFDYDYYFNYYKFLEKLWMCFEGNNFDINKDFTKINFESQKLFNMKTKMDNGELLIKDFSILKNSTMGIGINYFIGRKK